MKWKATLDYNLKTVTKIKLLNPQHILKEQILGWRIPYLV
jgi:hypothetical protein